jgi:hypothetical protein
MSNELGFGTMISIHTYGGDSDMRPVNGDQNFDVSIGGQKHKIA